MNQPLARSAGNALEVREAISFLEGVEPLPRLREVVLTVGAEMMIVSGLADCTDNAREQLQAAVQSGRAGEKFEAMVAGQGGPAMPLNRLARETPNAPIVRPVYPAFDGYVSEIDTKAIGLAVTMLGGGRKRPSDRVDPAVGIDHIASIGEPVGRSEPIAVIHAARESSFEEASAAVIRAYAISEEQCAPGQAVIRGHYSGDER